MAASKAVVLNLFPCNFCARKFVEESLQKHQLICEKTTSKKRRVFDSTKQRVEGTELSLKRVRQIQKTAVIPPKSNWRIKHDQFIGNIRNAKGVQHAMETGQPLPPPPPPTIDPDYIQCRYCQRRFSEKAADRHISFCKDQQSRLKPAINPTVKARQQARIQYNVPKPKTKLDSLPAMNPGRVGSASRTPPSRPPGAPASRIPAGPTFRNTTPPTSKIGLARGRGNVGARGAATTGRYPATECTDFAETYHDAVPPGRIPIQVLSKNIKTKNSTTPVRGLASASKHRSVRDAMRATSAKVYDHGSDGDTGMTNQEPEHGYFSGNSANEINGTSQYLQGRNKGHDGVPFCHECGYKYPVPTAKFCCYCGVRRFLLSWQ